MTSQETKQQILNLMAKADALALSVRFGTASPDAEEKIESISNEIETLSDAMEV